jgi:hypothetical protein
LSTLRMTERLSSWILKRKSDSADSTLSPGETATFLANLAMAPKSSSPRFAQWFGGYLGPGNGTLSIRCLKNRDRSGGWPGAG